MDELFTVFSSMAPEQALTKITSILERLMADLDTDSRKRFLMQLIEQAESDKVTGLVHL